uniref:Rieske domain protein n=1 Tax=uncultured Acidobacteria bacterium A3 TaxID=1036853 RepID=F8TTH8_9BACT|nr:Rieske domain protein [uncultured Acidobacteria bacterium A3]
MTRDEELTIIAQALSLIESNKLHMEGEVRTVPTSRYTSPQRVELERNILFRRFPIIVGFSSQLREPGSFVTHNHTGVPILVTRDEQGGLNAFVNQCRHRGTQLTCQPSGQQLRHLVCPFHAWSYDLRGNLRAVPQAASFPDLDRTQFGLCRLPVAERYGMIFVTPTPGATMDIDTFLGPLVPDLGYFGFDDYVADRLHETKQPFNWKLHMDATLEGYHIPFLHSRTQGGLEFQATGPHVYLRPHARMVLPHKSMIQYKQMPQKFWRLGNRAAVVWMIFPNTTIFCVHGTAQVTSLFPVDAGHCQFSSTMLRQPGAVDERVQKHLDFVHESFWTTMEEDHHVCESIQAAAAGGAMTEYVFGKLEFGISSFHATVDDALDGRYAAPGIDLAPAQPMRLEAYT